MHIFEVGSGRHHRPLQVSKREPDQLVLAVGGADPDGTGDAEEVADSSLRGCHSPGLGSRRAVEGVCVKTCAPRDIPVGQRSATVAVGIIGRSDRHAIGGTRSPGVRDITSSNPGSAHSEADTDAMRSSWSSMHAGWIMTSATNSMGWGSRSVKA